MAKSAFDTNLQKFSENRFLILLVLILFTIVLTPFLDHFSRDQNSDGHFFNCPFFQISFSRSDPNAPI